VAIFISEGRYLGGEAGESEPDWHWQSPLPKRRREKASPARTCRHRRSDEIRGKNVDQAGPFLLSGDWWDEKAWARAEWDMQLENGEIVRVHEADPPSKRASPPSSDYGATDSADGVWKLDGIYD